MEIKTITENPDDTDEVGTQDSGKNNSGNNNSGNQTPETLKKPEAVKTGDTANIGIIIGCMAAALVAAGVVLVYKRKREQ